MIHLYTDSSPNGFKITIALEEMQWPYTLHPIKIDDNQHLTADFLKLNPHGEIPVIIDDDTGIILYESAAILLYLADKTQQFIPKAPNAYWETIKWLMFHSCNMGPMLGQKVHFEIFSKEVYPPAIERYQRMAEENFTILDQHLAHNDFLAGTQYTIADMAVFGWTHIADICNFPFKHHKHFARWYQDVANRPAVARGIRLPQPATGP